MLLHILARGKIGRTSEAELVDRYLKRIAWPTKVSELPDRGDAVLPPALASVTIVLDERGGDAYEQKREDYGCALHHPSRW